MQTDQAFPSPRQVLNKGNQLLYHEINAQPGFSKREYAVIHAPSIVPDWFMPDDQKSSPELISYTPKLTDEEYNVFKWHWSEQSGQWNTDAEVSESLRQKVADHMVKYHEAINARVEYDHHWKIDRYFKWRKYFADMVTGNQHSSERGSPEEVESLESVIKEQDEVIRQLKAWRDEAIENIIDTQAAGEIIGLKIGSSVKDNIIQWMQDAKRLLYMSVTLTDQDDIIKLDSAIRKFLTKS